MKTPTTAPVRKSISAEVRARPLAADPPARSAHAAAPHDDRQPDEPEREAELADVVARRRGRANHECCWSSWSDGVAEVEAADARGSRSRPRRARRASRASRPSSAAAAASQTTSAPAIGRKIRIVVSQSLIAAREEDDGEDGEPARERERVGADEAVLDAAELDASRAGSRA